MQMRSVLPRSRYLEQGAIEVSQKARLRLRWFDYYLAHGGNAALIRQLADYFGISRQTFYRWQRRYDPDNLRSLEDGSHRPHRRRQPTWSAQLAARVLALRCQYPRWGKDKLVVLLRRQGGAVSVSMVGRILTSLGRRGGLSAPLLFRVKRRRGTACRPWPCVNPRIMRPRSPVTWCNLIPWTCARRRA